MGLHVFSHLIPLKMVRMSHLIHKLQMCADKKKSKSALIFDGFSSFFLGGGGWVFGFGRGDAVTCMVI